MPIFIVYVILLVCSLPIARSANALSAHEIMQKVQDRDDGNNEASKMEMILINKKGNKRVRKISSFAKDIGKDTVRLHFFLHPADVKNTGFLTYDYGDPEREDDQWLYLPALYKTKRIATNMKRSSFMGSDLTYADMTSRVLDDYEFKIIKENEIKGEKVWMILASPNKKAIHETGYTKSILFIRQDNFVVLRAIHWLNKGGKLKYYDVKKLELIDNIWVATETHISIRKGKKKLHKTILQLYDIKFNQKFDKNLFTIRQLENGLKGYFQ